MEGNPNKTRTALVALRGFQDSGNLRHPQYKKFASYVLIFISFIYLFLIVRGFNYFRKKKLILDLEEDLKKTNTFKKNTKI